VPLEVEINGHKEQIDVVVTDLNGMDMFLGYNWLVKHNLEVNWSTETMQFTRCLKICRTRYQNILFTPKNQRTQAEDERTMNIRK